MTSLATTRAIQRSGSHLTATEYNAYVGRALRGARRNRRWSQTRLATELGVTAACISYWENAITTPSTWWLARLEALFGRELRP